jgi:GT2 family glycosyltransferase
MLPKDSEESAEGAGKCPWSAFDAEWYLRRYGGDPELDEKSAYLHYENEVLRSAVSPNPYFDEAWYITHYPDVLKLIESGQIRSGFEHYCNIGYTDRDPNWIFSESFYRNLYHDIDGSALEENSLKNGYHHFLISGQFEGRLGSYFFDPTFYVAHCEDGARDPFGHFMRHGQSAGLQGSLYFDETWYRVTYPVVQKQIDAGVVDSGLHHYLTNADPTSFDPSPDFSEQWYSDTNQSLSKEIDAGTYRNCYAHYLKIGRFEERRPTPWFDPELYRKRDDIREALEAGKYMTVFDCYLQLRRLKPGGTGGVDYYGHYGPSGGWFFYGWVERPWSEQERPIVIARFVKAEVKASAKVCFFSREDLAGQGVGLVLFLPSSSRVVGKLVSVEIDCREAPLRCSGEAAQQLRDNELAMRLRAALSVPGIDAGRTLIVGLLSRSGYTGTDTLSNLKPQVFLEVDQTILCPPAGLMLIGWFLASPGTVAAIRVHSGPLSSTLDLADCIHIDRPDVIEGVGAKLGFTDVKCGFMAYAPEVISPGEAPYIEVETELGETGFRGLPAPTLSGMTAIKQILSLFDVGYADVLPTFDKVIGPAVGRLNATRLALPSACSVVNFGPQRTSPRISVIVPLFKRIDYLEYQLAFFSARDHTDIEYIYVLDDPPLRSSVESLAQSAFARFGLPFRLVMPEHNLGFAPANNLGLTFARGRYVCFVNSDIFPGTPDWVERLADRLEADSLLGAIGPLLLFEDGSVQHEGIYYESLANFGNLLFPIHARKGLRPEGGAGIKECAAITAACMMLPYDLALDIGGFDPAYVIGDFEDSDLCMKIHDRGRRCVVDQEVQLYHLERRSQTASAERWRRNLTLYNAWLHDQRWGAVLRARGEVTTAGEANVTFGNIDPGTGRPSRLRHARLPATKPTADEVL